MGGWIDDGCIGRHQLLPDYMTSIPEDTSLHTKRRFYYRVRLVRREVTTPRAQCGGGELNQLHVTYLHRSTRCTRPLHVVCSVRKSNDFQTRSTSIPMNRNTRNLSHSPEQWSFGCRCNLHYDFLLKHIAKSLSRWLICNYFVDWR
jgi:hypothetical protein